MKIDTRLARHVNDNLADYSAPVNADVQIAKVFLVPEVDPDVNPAGVTGWASLETLALRPPSQTLSITRPVFAQTIADTN